MVGTSLSWRKACSLAPVALAFAVLASVSVTPPASAQDSDVDVVNGVGRVSVVSVLEPQDSPTPSGENPGAPTEWPWTCTFYVGSSLEDLAASTTAPVPGGYYNLVCNPNPGFEDRGQILEPVYVYNPAVPIAPGTISSLQLRDAAQDFVVPTTLTVGLSPEDTQITGVETWFWPQGPADVVDPTATVVEQATAGGLNVTIEARYVGTTFSIDADPVVEIECEEFLEWTPGASNSPCAYSFTEETSAQSVSALSQWDFYWFDNAAQPTPVLYGSVTNTETTIVDVIDLEAVISRN